MKQNSQKSKYAIRPEVRTAHPSGNASHSTISHSTATDSMLPFGDGWAMANLRLPSITLLTMRRYRGSKIFNAVFSPGITVPITNKGKERLSPVLAVSPEHIEQLQICCTSASKAKWCDLLRLLPETSTLRSSYSSGNIFISMLRSVTLPGSSWARCRTYSSGQSFTY